LLANRITGDGAFKPRVWVVNMDPKRPENPSNWSLQPLRTSRAVAAAGQETEKTPLPSDADQAQALKLVKDVFKTELSKSSPADRRLLARKMLEQSRETKDDPATKYVLLREGRELANQAEGVFHCWLGIHFSGGFWKVRPSVETYSVTIPPGSQRKPGKRRSRCLSFEPQLA
jgi:hypothetical protein